MVQRGNRLRFGREPAKALGIGGNRRVQDLDGDIAVEPRIAGAVDLAHPAGADEPDDLVRTETVTRLQRHGRIISGNMAAS